MHYSIYIVNLLAIDSISVSSFIDALHIRSECDFKISEFLHLCYVYFCFVLCCLINVDGVDIVATAAAALSLAAY